MEQHNDNCSCDVFGYFIPFILKTSSLSFLSGRSNSAEVICGRPGVPEGGKLKNTTSDRVGQRLGGGHYELGTAVQYTCTEGRVLTGDSARTCSQEGTWTGNAPLCSK